jgi:hypothetical protein
VISFEIKRIDPKIGSSVFSLQIKTADGIALVHVINTDSGFKVEHNGNIERYTARFRDVRFFPGDYNIDLGCYSLDGQEAYDHLFDATSFRIIEGGDLALRPLPRHVGFVFLNPDWEKSSVS